MITDVPGIRVGHWTGKGTGVTVVLAPAGCVGAGEVRGGAPATRESALVEKGTLVDRVDAVVFSGGSAFGLATCDGVMDFLAERGQGFPTPTGPVPIVVGASIFDLRSSAHAPPGASQGRAAAEAAERGEPVATGPVGAGTGATVGKWKGGEGRVPGGVGSAAVEADGVLVGALAVVNAVGDVIDRDGSVLAGSTVEGPPGSSSTDGLAGGLVDGLESTTLVVVATNAALTKPECALLVSGAHDGFARALDPSHTRFDGDFAVALATGETEAVVDHLQVRAAEATAAAIRHAARHAPAG